MESPGAARCFQAEASHDLERPFAERRAVCRKQNPRVARGHFQRREQQRLEIVFYLKRPSSMRPRESRRIENNDVELFFFPRQPWQDRQDVIRDKTMVGRWHGIQSKILPSARERFLGEVHTHCLRADGGRGHGKRAGVGETIEQGPRREIANETAILSLVDKEPNRISRAEIDPVAQRALKRGTLKVRGGIAQDEGRRFPVRILFGQEPREDPPEFEINVERPEAKLRLEPLERCVSLIRNEHVHSEALDPSVRAGTKTQRVSLLRDELPVQFGFYPFGNFHGEGSNLIRDSLVGLLLRPSLAR